jgi:excisionase family DNA binding protein
MNQKFLTETEAQEYLKLSRTYLYFFRKRGELPYIKIGKKILYDVDDLQKFVELHRQQSDPIKNMNL